ncbi:protein CMSS1 isoform 1-T1 [Menidia menidia]
MGDDLGDEWWEQEGHSGTSEAEEEAEPDDRPAALTNQKPEKRKRDAEKVTKAKKKRSDKQKEIIESGTSQRKETEGGETAKPKKKRKKKKKTITDVLATSEPKAGGPADLQGLVLQHFSDKCSVIELEERELPSSSFLSSNDLTHSLSSYLKQVCPKWAKIQKQHKETSSAVVLIVCSSALRTIELMKQLTAFKGEAKAVKLFAKHIKIEEQEKLLQKGVTHIGVGTPGRIGALIQKEALNLRALRYLVLDWNWRDQKLRRMVDIPEIKLDFMKLLDSGILTACKEERVKIGLF